MTLNASFYRTSGLVLTLLGMFALVLTGGSFSHAHEIIPTGHEHYNAYDHDDDVSHHHDDRTQGSSEEPIHCGAPILTLVFQQIIVSVSGKERVTGNSIADLIPRSPIS